MKHCAWFLVAAVVICAATNVWAANSVVVESKQVALDATGVTIGAYVTNDVGLAGLIIPLELRELAPGSFTTSEFSLTVQGRVAISGLMDFVSLSYYSTQEVVNACSGPVSNSYDFATASAVDFISPDAVLWSGICAMSPPFPAGTDGSPGSGTPSFLLTFDVTGVEGWFEIDTCCVTPANHHMFVDYQYNPVIPSFQKGRVTIGNPVDDPPVAVCQTAVTGTDPGMCERASVDPAEIDGGSYDPDGAPITLRVNPLGPYPLGVNDIWLVVEDILGDMDSCQTTITVIDDEPPMVICPSDQVVGNDLGRCDAAVSFLPPNDDNCGVASVIADPPSGWLYPVGVTTVEVIATDYSGNADTCYFGVIVEDSEPPTAICPSDTTVEVTFGETGANVSFTIDADDNCPGVTVSAIPPSGSFFPLGTTLVQVTAYDDAGNPNACFFNVTVATAEVCNDRPADVNCDGVVDVLDVVTVVNSAFRSVPEPGSCCAGGP